jgi:hypothetical protein
MGGNLVMDRHAMDLSSDCFVQQYGRASKEDPDVPGAQGLEIERERERERETERETERERERDRL